MPAAPDPPQVTIWRLDLRAADAGLAQDRSGLDPWELARASRLRDHGQARRWLYAHSALRRILAEHLGVAPREVVYVQEPGGKPRVACFPRFHFSLTHSGDWAWVALAWDAPVGLDLERVKPDLDWRALLETVCTPAEAKAVLASREDLRSTAFYRIWVRKEALLKAAGLGLLVQQPLQTIETLAPCCRLEASGSAPWWLIDLPAAPGYVGALSSYEREPGILWGQKPGSLVAFKSLRA